MIARALGALDSRLKQASLPVQAAFWMVFGALLFSGMGAMIRKVSFELHPFEIAFFRTFFGLVCMLPWLLRHGVRGLKTNRPGGYLVRALFSLGGLIGGFYAVVHMPLADSVALSFTAPLFATAGAALFLGETVRARRWIATIIGFLAVLIIVRPGADSFTPAVIVALVSSAATAGAILTVKRLSDTEPANAIVAYLAIYLTPMALIPALFVWQWPSLEAWIWLFAMGLVGTLGQIFLTRGFAVADASMVMPFDYLRLPFTALIAYLWFAEVPGIWTFVGAGIIAASSVYIAWREAYLAKTGRA